MCLFLYRKSCMILPNPETIELQTYTVDDAVCLDISNNLFQETNLSDDSTIEYDNLCVVCLESNKKRKNITLPCNHTYHAYCIIKWLLHQDTNKQTPCCPFCKQTCDGNKLINDIISTNLVTIENILKKLEYISKYCSRRQQRANNIYTLKRKYTKLNSIFIDLQHKEIKDPLACRWIYITITPLMENVIKLISEAEYNEANPETNIHNNCCTIKTLYEKIINLWHFVSFKKK